MDELKTVRLDWKSIVNKLGGSGETEDSYFEESFAICNCGLRLLEKCSV